MILEACVWITGPIRSLLERGAGIETVGGTGARRYRPSKGARDRSDGIARINSVPPVCLLWPRSPLYFPAGDVGYRRRSDASSGITL